MWNLLPGQEFLSDCEIGNLPSVFEMEHATSTIQPVSARCTLKDVSISPPLHFTTLNCGFDLFCQISKQKTSPFLFTFKMKKHFCLSFGEISENLFMFGVKLNLSVSFKRISDDYILWKIVAKFGGKSPRQA